MFCTIKYKYHSIKLDTVGGGHGMFEPTTAYNWSFSLMPKQVASCPLCEVVQWGLFQWPFKSSSENCPVSTSSEPLSAIQVFKTWPVLKISIVKIHKMMPKEIPRQTAGINT